MASFRDIWNIVIDADSKAIKSKLEDLAGDTKSVGSEADRSIRGRMGDALGNVAQKIPGVSGLMEKFGITGAQAGTVLGGAITAGAVTAGTAVAAFVNKSIGEFQEQAQSVLHFKEVTGLAADEASRFVAVADDYAVSAEDLSSAVGKLDKTAGTAPEKLKALGIEIAKNNEGGLDAQQTFLNVVDAYNSTEDASVRTAVATAAFGKGWQGVIKLLEEGSGKLKTSFAGVKDFQLFSDADLQQSEDYRESMEELNNAVKGFEREIGQAAIPVATEFTRQLIQMGNAADDALGPFGGLNLLMQTAATVVFPAYESTGGDVAAASAAMTEELKKNVSEMQAIAAAIPEATKASDAYRTSLDLTVGQGAVYAESNAAYRKALDDTREAADKAERAIHELFDMKNEDARSDIGLQQSWYGVIRAYDTMTESLKAAADAKGTDHEANLKALEDTANYKSAVLDMAEADAKQYGNKFKLTHEAATASDIAAEAEKGYRLSLIATLQKMDPNDPQQAWLKQYIDTLYSIPSKVDTAITLNTSGVLPGQAGALTGRYASGTNYAPGGLSLVGESGPELVNLPRGSQVWPNGAGPTSGATINNNYITVNAGMGADGREIGQKVVAAIKQFESANGSGWRS